VFSALETFVIIALYKSTFTIPYHTIYGASIASCGKTRTVEWTNNTAEIQRELSRYWDSVGQVSATVPTVARQYSRPSISSLTAATFARHLKNHLFGRPNERIRGLLILRYTNARITIIKCPYSFHSRACVRLVKLCSLYETRWTIRLVDNASGCELLLAHSLDVGRDDIAWYTHQTERMDHIERIRR